MRALTQNSSDIVNELLLPDLAKVNDLIRQKAESEISLTQEIADYIINSGGKRLRAMLTLACSYLLDDSQKSTSTHIEFATAVELIHNASLMHDDVIDQSSMRRGKKCANLVWNNKAAILIGDFLLTQAFNLIVAEPRQDLREIFINVCTRMVDGEVIQLQHCHDLELGIEGCEKIVENKTAVLFAAACQIGTLISSEDKQLRDKMYNFGLHFGIAFQIADDILDYEVGNLELNKKKGDDFFEGKVTMPAVIAYNSSNDDEKAFLKDAFSKESVATEENFLKTVEIIDKTQALDLSRRRALWHGNLAKKVLSDINHSPAQNYLLDLVDSVIYRKN